MANADLYAHPKTFPPMPAVARVLARFDRPVLEGFITVAIGLLDVLDGDADEEANGDELDGDNSEDDFMDHAYGGPGCPVADEAEYSIPETTRQREFKRSPRPEDDEEDGEDCDGSENEPLFDRRQYKRLNRLSGQGAGCPVSDPDHGIEDLPEGTYGLDC